MATPLGPQVLPELAMVLNTFLGKLALALQSYQKAALALLVLLEICQHLFCIA